MVNSRDSILQALFNLLLTANYPFTLNTPACSRKMIHWDNVPSGSQPILLLQQGPQEANQPDPVIKLNRWIMHATAWVYFRNEQDKVTSTTICQVQDAIDNVITPVPGKRQSLGGLVTQTWIKSFGDQEGVLDQLGGQALVWCEIEILVSDRQGPV